MDHNERTNITPEAQADWYEDLLLIGAKKAIEFTQLEFEFAEPGHPCRSPEQWHAGA